MCTSALSNSLLSRPRQPLSPSWIAQIDRTMQPSFCQDIYIETGGRITRLRSMTWNNGDTLRSCVHHSTFMEFCRTRPLMFRVTMDRVESKVRPRATIDSVRIEEVRPHETIGKVDRVKRFHLSRLGPTTRSFLSHPSHLRQHVLTCICLFISFARRNFRLKCCTSFMFYQPDTFPSRFS